MSEEQEEVTTISLWKIARSGQSFAGGETVIWINGPDQPGALVRWKVEVAPDGALAFPTDAETPRASGVLYADDPRMMGGFNPFSVPDPSQTIEAERKQARAELRDRFAMAVVSGVYIHWRTSLDTMELGCNYEDIAIMAYDVADAMMKAREENSQ